MRLLKDEIVLTGAALIGTFCGLAIYNASKFDPQTFGIGAGLVLAAIGGGQTLRGFGGKDVRAPDPSDKDH